MTSKAEEAKGLEGSKQPVERRRDIGLSTNRSPAESAVGCGDRAREGVGRDRELLVNEILGNSSNVGRVDISSASTLRGEATAGITVVGFLTNLHYKKRRSERRRISKSAYVNPTESLRTRLLLGERFWYIRARVEDSSRQRKRAFRYHVDIRCDNDAREISRIN